ncbi:MAG: hypothetical protein WAX69_00170 [Victivallales bacterium]
MSRCQLTGNVTSKLILDLFRRLPVEKQEEYLESLKACVKIEDYRKAGIILRGSDVRGLKKAGKIRMKPPGERKQKDNAV